METNTEMLNRIDNLLKRDGINRAELARRLGISPQAISRWFKTGEVSHKNLEAMAKIFRVPASWIRYGDKVRDEQAGYETSMKNLQDMINHLQPAQLRMLEAMVAALVELNKTGG